MKYFIYMNNNFSCVKSLSSIIIDVEKSCPRLRSTGYNDIVAFSCFITTMQEGFLYHFPVEDGEVVSNMAIFLRLCLFCG